MGRTARGSQAFSLIAWLLLALLCVVSPSETAATTISVFLPEYRDSDWAALRGSAISSWKDKSETIYTIFCAEQAPTCQIAGDIPFIFSEGPRTLSYGGSAAGIITADLRCELAGTTAATCTGSSSFGPNYRQGSLTGPTQTVWTKTFSGSAEVTWGVLTLATPGPGAAGTTNIDGTAVPPQPTSNANGPVDRRCLALTVAAASIAVQLVQMGMF
ncbi:hypothetical protein B0H63DRAFT_109557 [Podospora didyma]|uniref:Uncharacterized protein n=1 Tax=Podospora didyma TaxID=330526 RepID=A0AAE0NYW7_9PEZI|nr:hypothetical protein B0H63DRAFT_109557 [Podospora didyma]